MRRYFAACTFEFPQAQPETWRGAIAAGSPQRASYLALKAARKAFPKRKPSSIVVLLEVRE
jgi:hypothetical protein